MLKWFQPPNPHTLHSFYVFSLFWNVKKKKKKKVPVPKLWVKSVANIQCEISLSLISRNCRTQNVYLTKNYVFISVEDQALILFYTFEHGCHSIGLLLKDVISVISSWTVLDSENFLCARNWNYSKEGHLVTFRESKKTHP